MCPPSYERHEAIFNDTERLHRMGGPILYILKCTIYKGCWIAISMLHCLGTPLNHSGEPTVRRIFLAFLVLIGTATGAVAADKSETIAFPFDPQIGDVFYYRIRKSDVTVGEKPKPKIASVADVSIEFLGAEEEGYVYRLKYLSFALEDSALAKTPLVRQMLAITQGLTLDYYADETGSPFAVRDLQRVKDQTLIPALSQLLSSIDAPDDMRRQLTQFVENMTPAGAAEAYLKDIAGIFVYTGTALPKNELVEEETAFIWQLTGTELVRNLTTEVVSVEGDIATLKMRGGYTRESVLAGMTTLLDKLGPTGGSEEQRKMRAGLNNLKTFDMRLEYDAKMSISTGWPVQLTSTTITDAGRAKRTISYELTRLATKPGPAR